MKRTNLFGIKFIGWFQVFGAIMVLLTLNVQQTPAFILDLECLLFQNF